MSDTFAELLNGLTTEERPVIEGDPSKWTNEQFMQWQVNSYNSSSREPKNGYNCIACRNRGYFAFINYAGDFALRACTCNNVQVQMINAKNSGFGEMLEKYTFENFKAEEKWQMRMKKGAQLYTEQKELPWMYVGGMSGAGKSHICTAAATKMLQQGKVVKYVLWRAVFHIMESYRYEEQKYNEYLKELGEVEVLIIDDFLKGMDKSKQGSALEIAFDIVNRRYNSNKATIFSSEIQLGELEMLDTALYGRIKEKCGKFSLNIQNDESRNYRKKKGGA